MSSQTLVSALRSAQQAVMRREGSTRETVSQALMLLRDHSSDLRAPSTFEPYEAGAVASCSAVLFKHAMPEHDVLQDIMALCKHHAADAPVEVQTAFVDVGLTIARRVQDSELCMGYSSLARKSYDTGVQAIFADPLPDETPCSSILLLLRAAAVIHGKSKATDFPMPPTLLPVKSKVHMAAKLQRCGSDAQRLVNLLHTSALTRTDAMVCLNDFANAGFYDNAVMNRCCDVLHSSIALCHSRQLARALHHLGVVGHRHVFQPVFLQHCDPRQLSSSETEVLVVALAMLSQKLPTSTTEAVHSALWKYARRPDEDLPLEWYVNAAHALRLLHSENDKFTVHMCRLMRTSVHKLDTLHFLRLYRALAGSKARGELLASPDLKQAWGSKVVKTERVLFEKSKSMTLSSHDALVLRTTLQLAGEKSHPALDVKGVIDG